MPFPKGYRPPAAGKGRQPGVQNRFTRDVKEMILRATNKAGGEEYLYQQSQDNPAAFLTLLGKVLPLQVTGEGGGALVIRWEKPDSTPDNGT